MAKVGNQKRNKAHTCSICKVKRISVFYGSCLPFTYKGYLCQDCATLLEKMYYAVCSMVDCVAQIKKLKGRKLHRVLEVVERLTSEEVGEWDVEKLRM